MTCWGSGVSSPPACCSSSELKLTSESSSTLISPTRPSNSCPEMSTSVNCICMVSSSAISRPASRRTICAPSAKVSTISTSTSSTATSSKLNSKTGCLPCRRYVAFNPASGFSMVIVSTVEETPPTPVAPVAVSLFAVVIFASVSGKFAISIYSNAPADWQPPGEMGSNT